MKKFLIGCAILFSIIHSKLKTKGENVGHWFYNIVIYQGRPGYVDVTVADAFCDGWYVCRSTDEYGRPVFYRIPFYITNRWLMTGGRKPSGAAMMNIQTQASCAGHKLLRVEWRTATVKRIPQVIVDMAAVQRNMRVARRTERLGKFHRWLARVAPSTAVSSYHPHDHRDAIIKRV